MGNILKRHGIPPAPQRKKTTTWKEFIRTHMDVLVATDFFTAEVWTTAGLMTYYVLFFIHLASRKVHVAGVTPHPDERWMVQVARNLTMEEWGFLSPGEYLIHDRDTKFCTTFQRIIDDAGVERVVLPPRAPNLNAFAERWVRSVKEETLSRLILFGERVLLPVLRQARKGDGAIQCHERLGGLLKYYEREAAGQGCPDTMVVYNWYHQERTKLDEAVVLGGPIGVVVP